MTNRSLADNLDTLPRFAYPGICLKTASATSFYAIFVTSIFSKLAGLNRALFISIAKVFMDNRQQTHSGAQHSATTDYRCKPRYRILFASLRPFVRLLTWLLFNYKPIRFHENKDQNYFILSNHTGSLDPLFLTLSFDRPIFFVASDHLFRLGWVSKVLDYLVAPIPIVKSKLDLKALRVIRNELEAGRTVALFPSGNRSVAGPEEKIPPATGKLLKMLKIPVLLFRLEGGYLTSPRWAKHHRRGKMSGSVVMHLTKEDLEQHSAAELDDMLVRFLDANPYSLPTRHKIKYRGCRPAEHLERVLYVCPGCQRLATLHSHKDLLSCSCGFAIRYTNTGQFAPATWNPADQLWSERYPNVEAFYSWQREHLAATFSETEPAAIPVDQVMFTDERESLTLTQRARHNSHRIKGNLTLYINRLEYRDEKSGEVLAFPLTDISDLSCIGPQRLQFTDARDGSVYESQNRQPRSAYKYIDVIQAIKQSALQAKLQTKLAAEQNLDRQNHTAGAEEASLTEETATTQAV